MEARQGNHEALDEMLYYCIQCVEFIEEKQKRKKTGKQSRDHLVLLQAAKEARKMKAINWRALPGKVMLAMELDGKDISDRAIRDVIKKPASRAFIEINHRQAKRKY
jgi:hypothetical protein